MKMRRFEDGEGGYSVGKGEYGERVDGGIKNWHFQAK